MLNILFNVIIYPLMQIVEFIFVFAQGTFKFTGFSIICVSIAITVICLPLYAVAEKWQELERDTEKALKPGVDRIKTAFTGDEQYMILSAYYKQHHYHPIMALRSSFGLLIQIPFFIAAYIYLSNLELLKGASFLFISNMGAPDQLIHIGNMRINLLPVAMTLINCIAGAVYTKGFPLKDKIQLYAMAGIFLVLLYASPSGLVLYWTMNNIFSLVKNIYYKIKSPYKKNVLFAVFAFFLLLIAGYLNYYHRGPARPRIMITILLSLIAVLLCFFPFVSRHAKADFSSVISAKNSFALFITGALVLLFTAGLLLPTNLINASPQEFSYIDQYTSPLFFIRNTFTQAFGFCIFWPVCLYFLFSDNVKRTFAVIFSAAGISALVNVFFFPGKYGFISTALIFAHNVHPTFIQSFGNFCILLIPVVFIFIVLHLRKPKILSTVFTFVIIAIFAVSVINMFQIKKNFQSLASYQSKDDASQATEVNPIFTLSKKGKNVVVLMIDRAISVLVPYIFEDYPELNDEFSGFVFYPNTVTFNGYTSLGSPPIFGGYDATPQAINSRKDVTLVQKRNEALMMMPRIFTENGFNVTAADLPYANGKWIPDMSIFKPYPNVKTYITDAHYTNLWCKEHNFNLPSDSDVLKRNILWYSLLKMSPLFLREGIYSDGNWCALTKNVSLRKTLNGYAVLDYLPRLGSITDDDSNNALIMDNNTTHEGSYLQAPDYKPAVAVTKYGSGKYAREVSYSINAAALMRLAEWFKYLKDNGVYDNTRIILVSDHGPETNMVTRNSLPFQQDQMNAFLMVKDFNTSGRIKTDDTFMTNADVPTLALTGIIKNPANPFTGNPINSDAKKEPLYIAVSGHQLSGGSNEYEFYLDPTKDYYVHDNLFDINNWSKAK